MNVALLLAGGNGSRLGGDCPKQYREINSKMVIEYCLETFCRLEEVEFIWVVAEEKWRDAIKGSRFSYKIKGFSAPGESRQLSIWNGMCDMKSMLDDSAILLIHDAARPLVSEQLMKACFEAVRNHEGVMPVLPMKDTVYFSEDGKVVASLLDRSKIYAGQSPEAFRFQKYYEANARLGREEKLGVNGSTQPAVMYGMDIVMIPGDERNFKITTADDLQRFKDIVEATHIS